MADPPWAAALDDGPDFAGLYANEQSPPGVFDVELGLSEEVAADLRARIADVAGFQDELGEPDGPRPGHLARLRHGRGHGDAGRV